MYSHRLSQRRAGWKIFPFSGRTGFRPDTRELVVPRLPYIAVYQVLETTVDVIAVFHAAQDKPRVLDLSQQSLLTYC